MRSKYFLMEYKQKKNEILTIPSYIFIHYFSELANESEYVSYLPSTWQPVVLIKDLNLFKLLDKSESEIYE